MGKICPLISGDEGGVFKEIRMKPCQEDKCAWWVKYDVVKEGCAPGNCAITDLALATNDGINVNVRY